jgi:hypothetical protein
MAVSRPEEKISSPAKSWTLMLRNPKAEGKKDSTPKGSGPLGMCGREGQEWVLCLLLLEGFELCSTIQNTSTLPWK